MSWKPKTQAAEDLESVIICDQYQHIHVDEALINEQIQLNYNIHRGSVDSFAIHMPDKFSITDVNGDNIAKWDIDPNDPTGTGQLLKVDLFSSVKNNYTLNIKMERFLQEAQAQIPLTPILTENAFRLSESEIQEIYNRSYRNYLFTAKVCSCRGC